MPFMIGSSGIVRANGAAAPFAPTDVSGIWTWLKADAGVYEEAAMSTLASDTDPAGGWADQSGNGRHFVRTPTVGDLTYHTNVVNSLPVVRCAGSTFGDYLVGPDASALTAGEIFIVLKAFADPQDGTDSFLWSFSSDSAATHYQAFGSIYDSFGTTARKTTVDPTDAMNVWHLYNVSSASGNWTSRMNGTQTYTTATNTVGFGTTSILFAGPALTDGSWKGDIAEVIIYDNVLSGGNRDLVEAYIASRYGITIA